MKTRDHRVRPFTERRIALIATAIQQRDYACCPSRQDVGGNGSVPPSQLLRGTGNTPLRNSAAFVDHDQQNLHAARRVPICKSPEKRENVYFPSTCTSLIYRKSTTLSTESLLREVLIRFGVSAKMLEVLRQFHDGVRAHVAYG